MRCDYCNADVTSQHRCHNKPSSDKPSASAREWWDALTPKDLGFPYEPKDDFDNYALNEWVPKALEAFAAHSLSQQAEKKAEKWIPISEAPKNGEHILAAWFGEGTGQWGPCREDGKRQSAFAVVHWWSNPGEEGWYLSLGGDEEPKSPTHFQRLREFNELADAYTQNAEHSLDIIAATD